jgi:hypothetical protein
MEEMDVFRVTVMLVPLQNELRDFLERRRRLHRCNTGGDFVKVVCARQLLRSKFTHSMFPFSAQLCIRPSSSQA